MSIPFHQNSAAQGALSSLMSMGGNLISGAIGGIFAKRENKRQRDYEREMYQRQYDDNLRLWQMQNQYNTPAQQMQRFKDAGLSPNLIYGQGTHGNAGNVSAPSPSIADQSKNYVNPAANLGNDMGGMISGIYDLRLKAEQINLTREQLQTQNTVQALNAITTQVRDLERAKSQTENRFTRETYQDRIDQYRTQSQQMIAQLENTRTNTKSQLINNDLTRAQTEATTHANMREWEKHKINLSQLYANVQNTKSSTDLNRSNLGLVSANTANSKQDLVNKHIQTQLMQLDRKLANWGVQRSDNALQMMLKPIIYGAYKTTEAVDRQIQAIIRKFKK